MTDEKIIHEPDPGTVLLDPATVIPEKLFTSIPDTAVLPEFIKYSSQDTEQSLKPFKIDKVELQQDGTTVVYYSVSRSYSPSKTSNYTNFSTGMITMLVYDKTEAEKIIFEIVFNSGWYK
jgi:hypothetical protein